MRFAYHLQGANFDEIKLPEEDDLLCYFISHLKQTNFGVGRCALDYSNYPELERIMNAKVSDISLYEPYENDNLRLIDTDKFKDEFLHRLGAF